MIKLLKNKDQTAEKQRQKEERPLKRYITFERITQTIG